MVLRLQSSLLKDKLADRQSQNKQNNETNNVSFHVRVRDTGSLRVISFTHVRVIDGQSLLLSFDQFSKENKLCLLTPAVQNRDQR